MSKVCFLMYMSNSQVEDQTLVVKPESMAAPNTNGSNSGIVMFTT